MGTDAFLLIMQEVIETKGLSISFQLFALLKLGFLGFYSIEKSQCDVIKRKHDING